MAYTLDKSLYTIPKLLLDHSKKRGDMGGDGLKSFRDVKNYRRRKRWL